MKKLVAQVRPCTLWNRHTDVRAGHVTLEMARAASEAPMTVQVRVATTAAQESHHITG
jgi:hypothetical protein